MDNFCVSPANERGRARANLGMAARGLPTGRGGSPEELWRAAHFGHSFSDRSATLWANCGSAFESRVILRIPLSTVV